jgi:hypothetical protein
LVSRFGLWHHTSLPVVWLIAGEEIERLRTEKIVVSRRAVIGHVILKLYLQFVKIFDEIIDLRFDETPAGGRGQ